MPFVGNLGMELCEDISTLLCVRSTSGKSVLVILFGGDDDKGGCEQLQITVFELMCLYYKCHSSFRDCLRDLVFGARCSYYICLKFLQMNLPCIHNRNSKKNYVEIWESTSQKKRF